MRITSASLNTHKRVGIVLENCHWLEIERHEDLISFSDEVWYEFAAGLTLAELTQIDKDYELTKSRIFKIVEILTTQD